ncbi:MAG: hypothetical protein ACRDRJ_34385 [Streptosporangiaceae bacterium]
MKSYELTNEEDRELRLLIDQRTREWDQRFKRMQDELDRKNALIDQQRQRADMRAYAQRRVAEERDEIAPELIDYIGGDTIEAVEASIATARSKTASIVDGIQQALSDVPDVQVPRTPAPAGIPPQGGQQQDPQQLRQPTLEELADLEVGSPKHLALRRAAGIDRSRGRGIFG